MFEMAEIKVEKFEIMDVITTSGGNDCPYDGFCWTEGMSCSDNQTPGG